MTFTLVKFVSSGFLPLGTHTKLCVDDEEALPYRTVDAHQTIRNYPSIFARIPRSMMVRVKACTESHGGHTDHINALFQP
jgi:hypothetical protein